jgi:hypothetical protein
MDYGTAQTVARLVSGKASERVERIAGQHLSSSTNNPLQTLHMLWHMRGADRAFREQRTAYAREIANKLALQRGLHFIGFMMNTVEDLASTLAIVRPLREYCPRLKIVGFGEMPSMFPEQMAAERNAFDCLCTDDPEITLVALAERIDAAPLWTQIPNLAFSLGGRIRMTQRDRASSLSALASPAYEPDAYPALKAEQKIRVFTIDECRPVPSYSHAVARAEDDSLRVRSVASVCNEMWRIGTLFGARAFHFSGEAAPASHVGAVAHELMRRGMSTVYTRASSISHAVPATFPSLYSSGCVAMTFPVDTGSQRLLDHFYGRDFTITDVERVLRCVKSIGMYAIARFTYPSPADDYHTRAETLRVIERTKPHAAPVNYPGLVPGSRWSAEAQRMGFEYDASRLYRQSLAAGRKFPALTGVSPTAHTNPALSEFEVATLHNELVNEIEHRGVCASLPDETVRLACIMGDAGREHAFAARVQREFVRGDAMGIATLVDLVNEVACVSAKRMALRAPDTERLAVGN